MSDSAHSEVRVQRHRDADEEALQAALVASMEPDFLAEILAAEAEVDRSEHEANVPSSDGLHDDSHELRSAADTTDEDLGVCIEKQLSMDSEDGGEDEEEDANRDHVFLNYAEVLLLSIMRYLDEDSIGHCICTCKRLMQVASSEEMFETLCRRIFPVQCPRVARAADRFALRKFPSWYQMFRDRPRVRYNGFYWFKFTYYKKPELNMWTEIPPGSILQVVYYRYFSFQRDGTVLYAMIFRPPHEASGILKRGKKEVYRGTFHVDRNEVFVSVPTSHSVVEFRFHIMRNKRHSQNNVLVLDEHYSFSEPDRTGWIDTYDTHEEEFQYYRSWNL